MKPTDKSTIMVVDDTPDNLTLLGEMLNECGYRTLLFPRGDLALKAALRNKPDLFLLDIMMPNMDGYQLCSKIKEYPSLTNIPVIYISALDDTQSKVTAFSMGAVDYISKPFQKQEVLARVQTHLKLQKIQNELEIYNNRLEEMVADQTADLIQAQTIAQFGNWKHNLLSGETNWSLITHEIFEIPNGNPVSPMHLFSNLHPDDSEKTLKKWTNFREDGSVFMFNTQYRIKFNTGEKWIHSIAEYQFDEQGNKTKIIGAVKDITERKRYLEELSTKNQTLQDLAWKQSHAFRAPLTRIMGLANFAIEDQENALSCDFLLEQIRTSAKELDSIVREISQQITESQTNQSET